MSTERPRSKSLHVVPNKSLGDASAHPNPAPLLEQSHTAKSSTETAADCTASTGSKRALTIRTKHLDEGSGDAHSAAPVGRVRVRSSTVSQSGESKNLTPTTTTTCATAATPGPASAGPSASDKGLPSSPRTGRPGGTTTDPTSTPAVAAAAAAPKGGRRSSLSRATKPTMTPFIKVKLNGGDAASSTNTTHVKGRKSADSSRQATKFSSVEEEERNSAGRLGNARAGADHAPQNSHQNAKGAASPLAGSATIANRPKSNTITGLAPQLLRAQRAAAEAAKQAGLGRRPSLLSNMSSVTSSSPQGPNAQQHTSPPTPPLENGGDAQASSTSYSSNDSVFSPVLPPPNSALRSSRSREPISRRMTVSWDTRVRNDSPGQDTSPTTAGGGGAKQAEDGVGSVQSPEAPSVVFGDFGRSNDALDDNDDGEEGEGEEPSTPKAFEVVGAALTHARGRARAQGRTTPGASDRFLAAAAECELCGIETGTLTVLLPCRHRACAACCSSGINQVSTSPPRSHVCAACRTPVESISLPRVVQRGAGGTADDDLGQAEGDDDDAAVAAEGVTPALPPPTESATMLPPRAPALEFNFQLDEPKILLPSPAVPTVEANIVPLHASQLALQQASPGQGAPMHPYPSMQMLSAGGHASPYTPAHPDPSQGMQSEMGWNAGSFDLLAGGGGYSDDGQSGVGMDSSQLSAYDFASSAVVRIDNIPWTISCDDVMKWLPDPVFTLAPKSACAQAIHIPIDLQNGKTSNACYLLCRDRKAAQRIVRARTNTKLCGRPVTLILTTFNELLDEIFTTRNLSASLDEDRAVYFTDQQLERLLYLLKEGGGQLKDGCKPIEFASSLMSLVPPRLAIAQKMSLFNVIHDMVNHCLSLAGGSPNVRPALDRLLLACSMCGAFNPEQKLAIIETARAALSALMLSDSMSRKSSPRARKAAALSLDGHHPGASPMSNHSTALLDPGTSPRSARSFTHLAVAGGILPALSHTQTAFPPELGSPAQAHFNTAPYATPPYATHEVPMQQAHSRASDGCLRPSTMVASARPKNDQGPYHPGGFAAPAQLFTPEYSPYQSFKPLQSGGPPSMAMSVHGDKSPLHMPAPSPATPLGYPPAPSSAVYPPFPPQFDASAPQTPLTHGAIPNGYFAFGHAVGNGGHGGGGGGLTTSNGMLLPPYAYPMGGMSHSASPMPAFGPIPPGVSQPVAHIPHGNELGLMHADAAQGAPNGGLSSNQPATKTNETSTFGCQPAEAVEDSALVCDGSEPTSKSLRDEVSASLRKMQDDAQLEGRNAGGRHDAGPSLRSLAHRDGNDVKEDQAGFDRLVDAVTNAIHQKKKRKDHHQGKAAAARGDSS
ncbi:hypothetical protein OC845_006592 [Tilletia horrida]|nr:hypothetical protein OC845_006592 [Tilletia horrida]